MPISTVSRYLTLACLATFSLQLAGQQDLHSRAAVVVLEAAGTPRPTSERLDAVLAPVACDRDQNLYFRKLGADPGASPLMRLSANGASAALYDPSKLPDNSREVDLLAFTVDTQQRVHQIVRIAETKHRLANYIVVFSREGSFVSKTKLDLEFIPSAFVALETGDYFVSGVMVKKSKDDVPPSVTALLDSSGSLKLDLKALDGDGAAGHMAAIEHGTAIFGDDKNIYLFRASTPVRLKVLNPLGRVIRAQQLLAPFAGAEPFEFRLSGNRILVGFRAAKAKAPADTVQAPIYVIFDSETGDPLMHYQFGESIRGALGCFGGDRFSFLTGTRDGRFAILDAKAR